MSSARLLCSNRYSFRLRHRSEPVLPAMGKCQQCHSPVLAGAGNAYSKICKECWKIRNSRKLGYCYVLEFEGGVYRIGHTVNIDKMMQAYTAATKVAWYAKVPVDVCRRISQRILSESLSARTPSVCIPWKYATNPKRKRRRRIVFFGENKLRSEICPGDIHQVCARCEVILAEELSQPVAHSADIHDRSIHLKACGDGAWVYFDPWYKQLIRHHTH